MDEYIKERLNDQIQWYSKKSKYYKRFYYGFSIALLVISSISSIISYLILKYKQLEFLPILSTVLTATIPIIIGIDKLMKCQELYTTYRATCERLKQEKILFQNGAGEYENLSIEKRNILLVNRCESIMSHENSNWTQLNEKKQNN